LKHVSILPGNVADVAENNDLKDLSILWSYFSESLKLIKTQVISMMVLVFEA
jgi:hypothetical protein